MGEGDGGGGMHRGIGCLGRRPAGPWGPADPQRDPCDPFATSQCTTSPATSPGQGRQLYPVDRRAADVEVAELARGLAVRPACAAGLHEQDPAEGRGVDGQGPQDQNRMQVLSDASKRTRLSAMASETAGPGSPAQVEVDVGFEDVPDRSRASPPGGPSPAPPPRPAPAAPARPPGGQAGPPPAAPGQFQVRIATHRRRGTRGRPLPPPAAEADADAGPPPLRVRSTAPTRPARSRCGPGRRLQLQGGYAAAASRQRVESADPLIRCGSGPPPPSHPACGSRGPRGSGPLPGRPAPGGPSASGPRSSATGSAP